MLELGWGLCWGWVGVCIGVGWRSVLGLGCDLLEVG